MFHLALLAISTSHFLSRVNIRPNDRVVRKEINCVQGVQGISDIITIPGLVNVDFADVKAIMCNSGTAMLGVGVATGKNRAEEAALVRVHYLFGRLLHHI